MRGAGAPSRTLQNVLDVSDVPNVLSALNGRQVDGAGAFTDSGAVACALCGAGQTSDDAAGAVACADCARGSQTELSAAYSETGATACAACAEGKFSNGPGPPRLCALAVVPQ